jgi:NAD(P)-dependent dehydrogenase (short-subunit alcohol dehydrogenase family)
VAVLDWHRDRAEGTCRAVEEAGGRAWVVLADVGDRDAVDAVFGEIEARMPVLHVLVNNAGTVHRRSFQRMAEGDWDGLWATNVKGAVFCTRRALPLLRRARPGKIINIASTAAFQHARKLTGYAATKGALASLSRSLAVELGPDDIRVNYVCPGRVRTEMTRKQLNRWLVRKYVERLTPLRRLGQPDDVAGVALFLASTDSDFVTGQGIVVDGGLTLRTF